MASENAAQVSQKMGTAIYAQSQQQQAADGQAGEQASEQAASADEDVVEAEIVDEEKPGEREGGAA